MTEWTVNNKLNVWYQKRYHIALAKQDLSRDWIYDSGNQKINAYIEWLQGFGVIASGAWDDNYLWSDAEVWNDAQPAVLATGIWNGRGLWSDAATWNDGV
jgi:hypothetical protein